MDGLCAFNTVLALHAFQIGLAFLIGFMSNACRIDRGASSPYTRWQSAMTDSREGAAVLAALWAF